MYKYLILLTHLLLINGFSVTFPGFNKMGAVITDIDIKKITPHEKKELQRLFNISPLLLFKNQKITPRENFEFCKIFDDKWNDNILHPFNTTAIPDVPQIALRGNCNISELYGLKDIKLYNSPQFDYNYVWHQDLVGSGAHISPKVVSLYMLKAAKRGGHTLFCSMEQGYDNIDWNLKKEINKFNVVYADSLERLLESSYDYRGFIRIDKRCKFKDDIISLRPLVIFSDNDKRNKKSLMLTPQRFLKFDKLSISESNDLYREIMGKYVIRPENTVSVEWEKNDLVIFNNRKLIHTSSPVKEYENEERIFTLCFLGTDNFIKRAF